MKSAKLMINGIPGNVANELAKRVIRDKVHELVPYSLTGPEIEAKQHQIESVSIALLQPDIRKAGIRDVIDEHGDFISIDFTHPSAVNPNAEFYCAHRLPFVMGTTGGDREQLLACVQSSETCAVIAPNMAKPIVGLQAMLQHAADTYPGLLEGFQLQVRESHQQGKADTSGTAKAIVAAFNRLGVDFDVSKIQKERDPKVQENDWGIPAEHLGGHAWHTYTLVSEDDTVKLEFTHNINGRKVYLYGILDAAAYLQAKLAAGATGKVFDMLDVLQSA